MIPAWIEIAVEHVQAMIPLASGIALTAVYIERRISHVESEIRELRAWLKAVLGNGGLP